jgi:cytochrome c-type biogenesis protein CcmH/NrfG
MHSNALDYVAQKKYPEALQIYSEIILLDPEDDQAYIIMGHIYMMMNEFEKAQASFKNAAHIDPDNIYEITPFYENMILQNPSDDMAHAYLGYAFLILGELTRAEAAFADALNLNPQNVQAQQGLQILSQTARREG